MLGTRLRKLGSRLWLAWLGLLLATGPVLGATSGNKVITLSGTNTISNWTAQEELIWSLTASATNTHSNVPTASSPKKTLILRLSSDGVRTVDFVFPGGVTTNWVSQFVRTPRSGQTTFGFEQYGSTVDIWADPDVYSTADGQLFGRASGINVFGTNFVATQQFSGVQVNDLAYDATTWDGSTNVPTRNALRDKIETLGAAIGYTITAHTGISAAPADATVYYSGMLYGETLSTSATLPQLVVPKTGTVKAFYARTYISGTLGTAEDVTIVLRLNNTTDFGSTTMDWDALNSIATSTGLTQAVTAGDTIHFKITTPTWATNPTNVRFWGIIYVE